MPIHAGKNSKQRTLEQSLRYLANPRPESDNEDFVALQGDLKDVYMDDFRHSYAGIFPIVTEVVTEETYAEENTLQQNLADFYVFLMDKGDEDLARHIYKLIDHVELEIRRLGYLISGPESRIKELDRQLKVEQKQLGEELVEIKTQMENVSGQASGIQTQLVAVLGVFSAIIITFSGGIGFVGNVLAGMADVSTVKGISIVSASGIVVGNSIFLLVYFIGKLTGRSIYATCETPDCSCKPRCWGLTRLRKRLPYVFWLNVLLMLLIFAPAICNGFQMAVEFFHADNMSPNPVPIVKTVPVKPVPSVSSGNP